MSVQNTVESLAVAARKAARDVASLSTVSKNNVLLRMGEALLEQKVYIQAENEKDLAEIPDNVKDGLKIIPVEHVSEVLEHALVRTPEAIEWDEAAEEAAAAQRAKQAAATAPGAVAH